MASGNDKDQRIALVNSLRAMPAAMRERQQWLLWSFRHKSGAKKPVKMPYYANGQPRGWPCGIPKGGEATEQQPQVAQGHQLDRQHLVTFDEAIAALERSSRWDGIGFAFLPGDGLIGVDIDGAIDADGEISNLCSLVMRMCPGYTERSVSGQGVHIILAGELAEPFKSDEIGLEVYCGSQYFICTGQHWSSSALEPVAADMQALELLRGMCTQAKREAQEKRAAERAAQAPARSVAPVPPAGGRATVGGDDFQRVNAEALSNLDAWVPALFGQKARRYGRGYRVSSKDLGRDLQEDIGIQPEGIQDFGEEVGKSAIDLVVQWGNRTPYEAMRWLAQVLGVTLRKPNAARPGAGNTPPAEGAPPPEPDRPDPPPPPPQEDEAELREAAGGGDGGKKRARINWDNVDRLFTDFRYQYGSDQAWDTVRREPIKIANLRNTFGNESVKYWMNSAERRVIFAEDVVFEPGLDLPEHQLNLFAGLPLEPEEGDCTVMLELLRHLCASSEAPGLGPEEIADWVMRWCALPLQQLGAKMDTALVFHGPQGTGKNLFFDVIRDLYGEYGVMVGQTELEDKYNTWLSGKMFIIGDEVVSKQEMYHAKNRLKWIVTQRTKIPIRAMHQDTRWESNHANLVFLSNENMPLALEEGDRRYLVIYTPTAHDGDLYARASEFLANGGARRFLHHLLTLDLEDFTEHTKPPITKAKSTLIELGYKPAERFMSEWLAGYLPLPMQVCSVEQLYRCFRRWADYNGERFPPKQADFTEQAKRFVNERVERDAAGNRLPPLLINKVVQLKLDPTQGGGRRAVRCWLPRGTGPRDLAPPGSDPSETSQFTTEGEWAAYCVDGFEKQVRRFLRQNYIPDEAPEEIPFG